MDFGQDIHTQQGCFVDHQDGVDFFIADYFRDFSTDAFEQDGLGEAGGIGAHFSQDLSVQLDDGAGGGDDMKDAIGGGVQMPGGVSQGGGFAAADFPGYQGHGSQTDGIVETIFDIFQISGFQDFLEAYL